MDNKVSACKKLLEIVYDQVGSEIFNKKAQEVLIDMDGISQRIPLEMFTNDSKSLEIMKEFNLDKPEIMIRFMVESFYAAFEAIQENVNELKEMEINKIIGLIESAKRMYDYGEENPEIKVEKFKDAQNNLFDASSILERQIGTFLGKIEEIDNQSSWKFFVKSKGNMSTIDTNIKLIRYSLDALENAVAMQMLIADELGKKIDSSVLGPYEEFYDKTFSDETCNLLNAYAFDDWKKEKYFLRLSDKKKNIKSINDVFEEYVDELEDYDDVIFE